MNKWQLLLATTAMTTVIVAPVIQVEASTSTYKVQQGDTLFKIATQYKTTVAELKQLNDLESNTIYLTQKLVVPTQTDKVVNTTNSQAPAKEVSVYQVAKGDTLSKIAIKHGTTIANIKQWNNLKTDVIYVGQALSINKAQATTLNVPQSTDADRAIANQLAKENLNKKKLTVAATKKYTKTLSIGKSLIGTPYVFGGTTAEGIDCSGFVYYAYKNAGIHISRKSSLDYFMNDTTKVDKPVPGDLVFFKNTYISTISHMGIYIGNNQFIHAGSNGVEISSLKYAYWESKFVAFKRFNIVK